MGVAVGLLFAANAFSQGFPMPGKKGEAAVTCPPTYPRCTGLPTWPYEAPIKAFKGRFVDSTITRDYQGSGSLPRTYRARGVKISPERGKVYMRLGSRLVSYPIDSFFTLLTPEGANLANLSGRRENGVALPGERYIPYAASVDPQTCSCGWQTPVQDSQDRLFEFDWDDRGYNYLAYSIFGWGIVNDSPGGTMTLVKQVIGTPELVGTSRIMVAKAGTKYYAFVGSGGAKFAVYDVTTPTSPLFLRHIPLVVYDWSKISTSTGDIVGLAMKDGTFLIYDAQTLATGGSPAMSFSGTPGWVRTGVTNDGISFYTTGGASGQTGKIGVYKPATPGVASSYRESLYNMDPAFFPYGIHYGAGYIASWGGVEATKDVRLWKVGTNGIERVELFNFFSKYYVSQQAGYDFPDGYTALLHDAFVYKHNGAEYLIYNGHGLGDVYELQGRSSLSLSHVTTGTKNSVSPNKDKGPYYGDPIAFSVASPVATSTTLNFDNPEAGGDASISATAPFSYTHQYQAVVPANPANPTEISRLRTVTVAAYGDPENVDSNTLSLLVPEARVAARQSGQNLFMLQPNASAAAPLVYGDELLDASDGRTEGHFSVWTLNGATATSIPGNAYGLLFCGAASLDFEAHYTPYTVGAGIQPKYDLSKQFIRTMPGATFDVRPFVAEIGTPVKGLGTVTFKGAIRINPTAGAYINGAAAQLTVTWSLLPPVGDDTPIRTQTGIVQIGAIDNDPDNSFLLTTGDIVPGRRIVFSVVLDPAELSPNAASCNTAAYLTSTKSFTLKPADPTIIVTGCDRVANPCTLTAQSGTNDMSGWSNFLWKVDGTTMASGATKTTYTPSFATPKTYLVELVVTNVLGDFTAAKNIVVDAALCNGKPGSITFNYSGANSGCLGANGECDTKIGTEPFNFSPYAWAPYQFQDCDSFSWDFGDGGTSTQRAPTHSFPASGPYTVKLTVTNINGSSTFSQSVGKTNEPPPPPICPALPASVSMKFIGSVSGCTNANGLPCKTGESIQFTPATSLNTCHVVSWNFGDNTPNSGFRTANHVFASAGRWNVTMTVTHQTSGATRTNTLPVTTEGAGGTCTIKPSLSISMSYSQASSGCSTSNATPCLRTDPVTFKAEGNGYTFQSCDTFEWNFGDGTAPVTTTTPTTTHLYTTAEPLYNVSLTVKNSNGTKATYGQVPMTGTPVEKPTNVRYTASKTRAGVGEPITFEGAADSAAAITKWEWDFGDGTSKRYGQTQSHGYLAVGTYVVSLTVYNAGGGASYSAQVTIANGTQYAFLLPVVVHGNGNHGSRWRTDLQLFNPDPKFTPSQPVEIRMKFQSATQSAEKVLMLDSATYIKEDFLSEFPLADPDDAGAVIVTVIGEVAPQMWTRTYTELGGNAGTYGQLIPAVPLNSTDNQVTGALNYALPGAVPSVKGTAMAFRTNVGVVNPHTEPLTAVVRVIREDSVPVAFTTSENGELNYELTLTINPFSLSQVPLFVGAVPTKPLTVQVQSPTGQDLLTYLSLVDNTSGDPVFTRGLSEIETTDAARKVLLIPGVGRLGSWQSDFTLHNPGSQFVAVDIEYIDELGHVVSKAENVSLPATQSLNFQDVLSSSLFTTIPAGNTYGTLRVTTRDPQPTRYPVGYARTYNNKQELGTYGQGIPAFAAAKANVRQGVPAFIAGVRNESQRYRTNVGLVAASNQASVVRVTLLDSKTGTVINGIMPQEIAIAGDSAMTPKNVFNLFGAITVTQATLRFDLVSGGPVWAFASVVDENTDDPEYVPAVPIE